MTKLKQIHELHAWASDVDDEFHGLLLKQASHKLERFYHHVDKKAEDLLAAYKKLSRSHAPK